MVRTTEEILKTLENNEKFVGDYGEYILVIKTFENGNKIPKTIYKWIQKDFSNPCDDKIRVEDRKPHKRTGLYNLAGRMMDEDEY